MVMVVVRAKGALWGADASLLQSLAVADMHRGPTTVDVTLNFRGRANKTSAKSVRNQFSDLYSPKAFTLDVQPCANRPAVSY